MQARLLLIASAIFFHCWMQAADPIQPDPRLPSSMPWDLDALSRAPAYEWVDEDAPVRSLLYEGPDYQGRPTQVFAYYASPATLGGDEAAPPFPGIVLVHGGGGTAFAEWVELWARRGYAAIAMDLAGSQPVAGRDPHDRANRIRLPNGGPDQSNPNKFGAIRLDPSRHWCYHAPANVILAHSLLRSFAEVDRARTALTGVSWGGYLVCIVAGLDNRFKAAVPVYGCGFLDGETIFRESLDRLSPADRARWMQLYDPGQYLPAVRMPVFLVNGTNDFAYWLSAWQRSADAVPATTHRQLRLQVNMPHNHAAAWAPPEITRFIDRFLKDGSDLPLVLNPRIEAGKAIAELAGPAAVACATLHYTIDDGPEPKRRWKSIPLEVAGVSVSGGAPPDNAETWFINVTDSAGQTVSSPTVWKAGPR